MAIVSQGNQGAGNLTLLDHVVSFPVSGANSATAEVTLSGTFVGTVTWEMALDPKGNNWVPAPYAQRTDSGFGLAPTATAPGVYEIPLPGNCCAVRAHCTAFTSGSIAVQGGVGRPFVPGVPVVGVLADLTAVPTGTTIYDVAGWTGLSLGGTAGATGTIGLFEIDDAGAAMPYGFTSPVNVSPQFGWGVGSTYVLNANSFTRPDPLPRRAGVVVATLAAPRVRLLVRR